MSQRIADAFSELVTLRYQLYNGLFMTLPLDAIQHTGVWLPLLHSACDQGFTQNKSPETIIREFFAANKPEYDEREQIDFLFKIIKYVERQIVLVDALEDSAYSNIHRVSGANSWLHLVETARQSNLTNELAKQVADMAVRVVLTAHPTQFYPETVLSLITDLKDAIAANRTALIRDLLDQLGRTPFIRRTKPTPLEEAKLLINYLAQVFYPAIGSLLDSVADSMPAESDSLARLIQVGFWPGGDRDGNPFVTTDTTRKVAQSLKSALLRCYAADLATLRRRFTFAGAYEPLRQLEDVVRREEMNHVDRPALQLEDLTGTIETIEAVVRDDHDGLFLPQLQSFKRKVLTFGLHFASLDLRQDSRVIAATLDAVRRTHPSLLPADLDELPDVDQIRTLLTVEGEADSALIDDPVLRDTLESVAVIADIQRDNGEAGAHRYIISNCRGAVDVARLIALFRLGGWGDRELTVDIVPLFETIDDLKSASASMAVLYAIHEYQLHLYARKQQQTVMFGFSDGTKDGGYLMANWAIYRAKEEVTRVSREAGFVVHFFDGRGGPPSRGGGNSHQFYSALGSNIERQQIQLTLQGQTISSHYGIRESALHNLEMLLTAGLSSRMQQDNANELTDEQRSLIEEMATLSYEAYSEFKSHPLFVPYLLERSTLRFYGMANIGSRPTSRGKTSEFRFEDLRAIPFVGAWSQLKQNVPGFYGLGTAIQQMKVAGRLGEVKQLYRRCGLFRAFITNSMQSMSKTNFQITRYMREDERFGEFWEQIHREFELSVEMVLEVSGQQELLADNARSRESIRLREEVVRPLLTIQQYGLIRIQQLAAERGEHSSPRPSEQDDDLITAYEKMVMRSLFGNINATRNAV